VVDPGRMRAPVLRFYKRLPNADRQFVILPGAAGTSRSFRRLHAGTSRE